MSLAENVEEAIDAPENDIDRYIAAFTERRDRFEIYFPDGKPIQCQRPRRYGGLHQVYESAKEWYQQLTREDLETDHPLLFQAVQELGQDPITTREATASFFIKHFCVKPHFNDVQAAQMIGCPELLDNLYHQLTEELSSREKLKQLIEVKEEGKGSKATAGTTSGRSPARSSATRTRTGSPRNKKPRS